MAQLGETYGAGLEAQYGGQTGRALFPTAWEGVRRANAAAHMAMKRVTM